jgi:hypothetical protein
MLATNKQQPIRANLVRPFFHTNLKSILVDNLPTKLHFKQIAAAHRQNFN